MAFTRPTLQDLITRIESDFVSRLVGGGTLLRKALVKVIARVLSGAVHHLYGYIAWTLKQVLPDTAEKEFLERWGKIWGIFRIAATFATGNGIFTGTIGTQIPAKKEVQSGDGLVYTTDVLATIGGGGTVTVSMTAQVAGVGGNLDAGTILTMTSPIAGINSSVTVDGTGIVNGSDEETDPNYLVRILNRIQLPPNGGSKNDYIEWAKEVSGVTRAWVSPQQYGSGTLALLFVEDALSPITPNPTKIAEVQAYIDDVSRRPVTASVTVIAPTAVNLNPNISLIPNTTDIRNAVRAELIDLLTRKAEPGATLHLSEINEAISIATGETSHVLNSPVADVTYTALQVGVLGAITWS